MLAWYHFVWLAIPIVFFLMALWTKLELMSGRPRKEHPRDMWNQGIFLLVCCVACVLIDIYVLIPLYQFYIPQWIPLGLLQFLLLPALLLLGATISGPSKDIKITKAPHPTKRDKK